MLLRFPFCRKQRRGKRTKGKEAAGSPFVSFLNKQLSSGTGRRRHQQHSRPPEGRETSEFTQAEGMNEPTFPRGALLQVPPSTLPPPR